MKTNKKKLVLVLIAVVLLVGLGCLGVYCKQVADYQKAVQEIFFVNPNISAMADGIYVGECDVRFIYAKVEVTVKDGTIQGIRLLEHKNGRGKRGEAVIGKVVQKQNLDVDAISGATNSSLVIKKAVENALLQAPLK